MRDPASMPVFVGRAEEMAAVRAVVERACAGRSGALLISGDAGVGKTELVSRALGQAVERATVLRGASLPLTSMTVPYLPLRAALSRLAADCGIEPTKVLDGRGSTASAPLEFDAWVTARCRESPMVLAIDDLNWSDQSTLDLLMFLLAGPADRRLATLLTLRRGEVGEGHPLNRWLADVRRLPGFELMALEPLDRRSTSLQIAGLFQAPPHESLVDDVFARTRGNAYLTRLIVSGLTPDTRHLPAALPTDLQGALLATWHRLSRPARELTKVVAVGGHRVTVTGLAKVLTNEAALGDVTALLHEAVALGVLDVAADGTYWFHHPLQAQVLERNIPVDERRVWHATFAAHLEGSLGPPAAADVEVLAAIADHHYLAGHRSDAYEWALRAADAAGKSGGTSEQIRLLGRALELREDAVSTKTAVDLLLLLRDAAAGAGDDESELRAIEDLLAATTDEHDALLRAELLVRHCQLRFATGRDFMSLAEIEHALRLTSVDPDSWQHALALAEMGHVGMWENDPRAAEFAERAIAAARRSGHPKALSYALAAGAIAAAVEGRDDEGLALANESRLTAIEAKDYWAYVHASMWEVNCITTTTSERGAEQVSRHRRELQDLSAPHPYVALLASDEAASWVSQGRWDLAAQPLRLALGANPGGLADVKTRLVAARLAAFQGRVDEALAHMQRADELCANSSAFLPLESDAVRAEVLLASGDAEAAFASAMRGAAQPGTHPTLCERLIPLAARSLADLLEDARARRADVGPLLARVGQLTLQFPEIIKDLGEEQPSYHAQIEACAAWYAAELGRARRVADNAPAWDEAARLATAAELPWDAAYAGLRAAQAHLGAGAGHRQAAAETLRRSYKLARSLKARPITDAIRQLAVTARLPLGDVDQRVSVPEAQGLPGLTPRETEILGHIVAGRTYSEIARALVLSEKTVSSHVSNMLRKCGAANRVELARLAVHADPKTPVTP